MRHYCWLDELELDEIMDECGEVVLEPDRLLGMAKEIEKLREALAEIELLQQVLGNESPVFDALIGEYYDMFGFVAPDH